MTTTQETHAYETAAADLMRMFESGPDRVFVIDLQDPETFHGRHIPGARNVHLEDIAAACGELPKDHTVVIYCADDSCGLPLSAALDLAQSGLCAKYLHGGLEEWCRGGFPVESSPPSPPPEY